MMGSKAEILNILGVGDLFENLKKALCIHLPGKYIFIKHFTYNFRSFIKLVGQISNFEHLI